MAGRRSATYRHGDRDAGSPWRRSGYSCPATQERAFTPALKDRAPCPKQGWVFASAAAIGAGLEVAVEQTVGEAHISTPAASAAVTLPTALFLLTVWALHARHFKVGVAEQSVLPTAALLVLCCTFAGGLAVLAAGLVLAAAVASGAILTARRSVPERGPAAPTG